VNGVRVGYLASTGECLIAYGDVAIPVFGAIEILNFDPLGNKFQWYKPYSFETDATVVSNIQNFGARSSLAGNQTLVTSAARCTINQDSASKYVGSVSILVAFPNVAVSFLSESNSYVEYLADGTDSSWRTQCEVC
jgi:hypothetical protein